VTQSSISCLNLFISLRARSDFFRLRDSISSATFVIADVD
jgi:hypothetical protein